ncbi:hypothetical protein PDJAM_G00078560 [Pangasius djambal]|uniref:Uncharacterized protein n=1 Tax=Pangasius djambal TaxID=1691987 RepID=A0ACC5Z204_9TELE|nr:hypothetical protein [Pangasius djambal]
MAASVSSVSVTLNRCVWNKSRLIPAVRRISAAAACLRTHSSSDRGGSSVTESTDEFRFVERLISPTRIPPPPKHTGPAPSGWTPPSETPPSLPYMIRRSRMHNIPVYSDIKHGNQKSTVVRKVEGDIWALNKDVKEHLQQLTGREPPTKVNEVTMSIRIKGQFDTELKDAAASLVRLLISRCVMERVWRRRTPAFVRSLLMDVSLKEDELSGGTEPEQMSKDGLSLPVTAASGADLTPAAEEENTSSSSSSLRPCGLCLSKPARYTCPRCNVPYCALSCYRGSAHTACSEQFYKDCVSQELRQRGRAEHEDRIHMRDILLRMRRAEGGLGGDMREPMESSGGRVTERDTETLTLLSRLAEIQTDREEGHEDEVQDILQRLAQTDEEEEEGEEEEDVVTRLSGINIESLAEDELWTLLPEKDKQKFERLLKDGGISALVPIWRPWWEEHERDRAVLIEELQREGRPEETSGVEEGENRGVQDLDTASEHPSPLKQDVKKQKVKMEGSRNAPPPMSCEIPPLSSLCSASPSPLVRFSLVNVLYGYAFTLRLFNGDVSETQQLLEFTQLLLSVSECLGRSRTFGSFSEALSAAMASISAELYDSDSALSAVEGVAHILSGASKDDGAGYTLSALAQLRSAFSRARTAAPRDHAHFRRMCFLAGKKCEFLQAWANENTHTLRGLATQAWSECQTQTGERQAMERERKQVEESWKKGRARGKVMIEEI